MSEQEQPISPWQQAGWATYAAIMLFGGGIVGIVNAVWAFRYEGKYEDLESDLVILERNLEVWGAISLVVGALAITAGIGVFYGRSWARWTGIGVSVLAIIGTVGWAQIQAMPSLIGALIFGSVIYALATTPVTVHRND